MIRLSTASLALLVASSIPLGAAAQERPLVVRRDELPPLPTLEGRRARRVARLERVARRTLRCVAYEGDRGGEEYSDDRCWGWYDRLDSAGASGAHATGRVALRAVDEGGYTDSVSRLITLLSYTQRKESAVYLLHLLARGQGDSPESIALASQVLRELEMLSQLDAAPIAPWLNRMDTLADHGVRAAALDGWLRWYDAARDQPLRRWRSAGLAHAAAHLHDEDPAVRFAAIVRLQRARRQHHALARSIRELLVQEELSPTARRYVSRFAGRHALLTRAEIRELLG